MTDLPMSSTSYEEDGEQDDSDIDPVEAARGNNLQKKIERSCDCFMCRLLSRHTNKLKCGRCGHSLINCSNVSVD